MSETITAEPRQSRVAPAPVDLGGGARGLVFERLPSDGPAIRRVLFVTNMWPEDERPYYGSFIASQARSLPPRGVAVDVLYVRGYLGLGAYAQALPQLARAAGREPYDLVHVHYGHTVAAAVGIRRRPLVASFCGGDLLGEPRERGITLKSRIEVAAFRQLARLATATITKSEEMERVLPAAVRRRNHVLPNGVDLDRFAPRAKAQARVELGWEEDVETILFLGNPEDPRKNVELARAAAERVRATRPQARLHVAWGIPADRVPLLMNAADCLVFPSRSEGSPNVIKEAMASGLPIVSTPVGDVPERLAGIPGCHVRDPQAGAFAEALLEALDAGEAPEARLAVESLGLGAVAEGLMEIYDEAIAVDAGGSGGRGRG